MTKRAAARYLAVHLERTLSYIAHRAIRGDFRPAPIAVSLAARDLSCSKSTWVRGVRLLARLGLIDHERRPGRPKGGGKNPGSLYRVRWDRLAALAEFEQGHVSRGGESKKVSRRTEMVSSGTLARLINSVTTPGNGVTFGDSKWCQDGTEPSLIEKEGGRPPKTVVLSAEPPAAAELPHQFSPPPPPPFVRPDGPDLGPLPPELRRRNPP